MKAIFLILLILSLILISCSNKPGEYDSLAQCLTEKGAAMYGTEWCSHCQNQKATFGRSFKYIYYIDCDRQSVECKSKGIKGYPTWIIDGELYPGEQNLFRLASAAGCDLD